MRFQVLLLKFMFCIMLFSLVSVAFSIAKPQGISQKTLNFYTELRQQGKNLVFDIIFRNPTSQSVIIVYGECDFSFIIRVTGREYTFPMLERFAFEKQCVTKLNKQTVAKYSLLRLFSRALGAPLVKALHAAKLKYSGEFHFRFSKIPAVPYSVMVYKTP